MTSTKNPWRFEPDPYLLNPARDSALFFLAQEHVRLWLLVDAIDRLDPEDKAALESTRCDALARIEQIKRKAP
jgi:hypothetical protein